MSTPTSGLSNSWVDEQDRQLLPVPRKDRRETSVILDPDGRVLAADSSYSTVLGCAAPIGSRWTATIGPHSVEELLAELRGRGTVDRIVPVVADRPRWYRVQGRRTAQGGTGRPVLACQIEDLTDADGSLAAELIRDPLTGLYNRRAFLDLAALPAISTSRYQGVLLVDIRGFRRITELWGQQIGDLCLVEAADWLRGLAGDGDVVMSLSGSRFIVVSTAESAIAEAVAGAGTRTVAAGWRRILLSLQAGWADRSEARSLLAAADEAETALAVTKRDAWRAVVSWTPAIARAAARVAAVEEAVQQAVAAGLEAVSFQPIVDLAGARVSGVEALVRMGGAASAVPTDEILAASHKLGLTPNLAGRVYDLAFSEGLQLREVFPECLIGVNVSREFLSTGLAIDTVLRSARRAGVALEQVVVELTEDRAVGLSSEVLTSELRRGAEAGMQMVIDDFGRGETSLSLLRSLPLAGIKLDRSLLPADDDAGGWDFLEATVALLRRLTGRIIAEGVENLAQSQRLRGLGIDRQQGYFFGQPETSAHWLRAGPPALPG